MTIRNDVLQLALTIVDGPRNENYGQPEDSFHLIAQFWNNYLEDMGNIVPIKGHDVAVMLMLLKIARLSKSRGDHSDSWIDVAGYAACGYESFVGLKTIKEVDNNV